MIKSILKVHLVLGNDYTINGDTLMWKDQRPYTRTFQGDIYGDTLYNSKGYFIKVENPLVYLPKLEDD